MISKEISIKYFTELYDELNCILCEWDPFGLSVSGAIQDEFSSEAFELLQRLSHCKNEEEIAIAVSEVFATSFGDEIRFSAFSCKGIAGQIFRWWHAKP